MSKKIITIPVVRKSGQRYQPLKRVVPNNGLGEVAGELLRVNGNCTLASLLEEPQQLARGSMIVEPWVVKDSDTLADLYKASDSAGTKAAE
jgi:hypothetical protein